MAVVILLWAFACDVIRSSEHSDTKIIWLKVDFIFFIIRIKIRKLGVEC